MTRSPVPVLPTAAGVAQGGLMPTEISDLLDRAVHGCWDLALAVGQRYEVGEPLLAVTAEFLDTMGDMGRKMGAFGPVVAVGADTGRWGQLPALTGRDPGWRSVR